MPIIRFPKSVSGRDLLAALRECSRTYDFAIYDHQRSITLDRPFPEFLPRDTQPTIDIVPSLRLELGWIDPEKTYEFLECRVKAGALRMNLIDVDHNKQFGPFYKQFVRSLNDYISNGSF